MCLTLSHPPQPKTTNKKTGRRSSRLKHLSIRETTIAMAGATVVHALLMVGAGIANITANRYLSAAQATCIAVTMGRWVGGWMWEGRKWGRC